MLFNQSDISEICGLASGKLRTLVSCRSILLSLPVFALGFGLYFLSRLS